MQTHQRSRPLFRQSKVVSIVKRTSLVATVGLLCVVTVFGNNPAGADAQARRVCTDQDHAHLSTNDDASVDPATHDGISQVKSAISGSSHIRSVTCISDRPSHPDVLPNSVQVVYMKPLGSRVNRATHGMHTKRVFRFSRRLVGTSVRHNVALRPAVLYNYAVMSSAVVGGRNPFPYGQCTWWADQRYYQIHGVFVPWRNHANAWQWTTHAIQVGWRVSAAPRVGDIMVLQPGVEGASSFGHVGVVEQVLSGGRVIASSMNWGSSRGSVTDFQFVSGSGVAFVSQ